MTIAHYSVYPVLPAVPSTVELDAFIPSADEVRYVRRQVRQESTAVLFMAQLKLL